MTIKRVLAATDFSERSRNAVHRAVQICREHGARLELLHIVEELSPQEFTSPEESLQKAGRRLQDEADYALVQGVDCSCQIERGKAFVSIIQIARKMMADLIVVGAHGHYSLRDNLLGTTAERLVRKAGTPVLIVKQPPQTNYRRVLVPTDFSDASRQALSAASVLAPGACIDLLHVYGIWGEEQLSMAGADAEALERYWQRTEIWAITSMNEWRRGINLAGQPVEQHFRKGYAASMIARFAAENRHDLVVMSTVGRSGLTHSLLGSVTERTLRTVAADVLTVRSGEFRFELP